MITNARMAELYGKAHDKLQAGWTQGEMFEVDMTGERVCLVGSLLESTDNHLERAELQLDVADTLLLQSRYARVFSQTAKRQLAWSHSLNGHPLNSDGGIAFIERWNDRKLRRKKTVLKLLAERRDHYAALAKEDRLLFLEQENERLRGELARLLKRTEELEIEVSLLKVEVGFWKNRALNKKRLEFAGVLSQTAEVIEKQEQITMEMWELRKPN